jgi:hypothetical protein
MNELVKERLKSVSDALLAFSLVNLCLIRTRFALFFDKNFRYYKHNSLTKESLLALGLNLIVFGLIGWRLIRWVRRADSRNLYRAACVIVCALLVIPVDFLRTYYFHVRGSEVIVLGKSPFFIGSGLVVLFVFWHWPRTAARVLAAGLMICVPMAVLTFGKIGYYLLNTPPRVSAHLPSLFPTPLPSVEPRVIWIIYDELDQRLAFSNRPKDTQLPELDRVCAESLQATNAFPPGTSTIISLPALTTGRYVISAKPVARDELNITYVDASAPVGWSTQPTVFSRARELGFNTALVGWYHPYTRLFASCLNYSVWYPYPPYQPDRSETVLRSMITQIWSLVSPLQQRWMQIDLYRKSQENSRDLVRDGHYGLVFLHLPGPHYPGIYDAAKGAFTLTSFSRSRGYFQNLQLTDITMGILRRDMEQAGQWDRSWVIISSDHWWRDARGYDGQLDYRVPFILKAPGKNQPTIYGAPLNTVISKDLVLAILRKEISTIPEAVTWLDTHPAPPAPSYAVMMLR